MSLTAASEQHTIRDNEEPDMRRIALLGLVLGASAGLTSSAYALEQPQNLPFAAAQRLYTGKSVGSPSFNASGASVVVCGKAAFEGSEEKGATGQAPEGGWHMMCEEASSQGVKCTGLGDTTGVILALGRWSLVWDRKKGSSFGELTTATLFKIEQVHFNCTALVLLLVQGEQLCLDLKSTETNKTHTFTCIPTVEGGSEQSEEYCRKDNGTECVEPVAPVLLASVNLAIFKDAAWEMQGNSTFVEELHADI
jgi:hypothetical protein